MLNNKTPVASHVSQEEAIKEAMSFSEDVFCFSFGLGGLDLSV